MLQKKIINKKEKINLNNEEVKLEFQDLIKEDLLNQIHIDEDIKRQLRKNQEIVSGKIFFIYIRVSKQGEYDMSLVDQLKTLIGNANRNGHKIFITGEMKSGSTDGRWEFNLMVKTMLEDSILKKQNRKYGGIYVFKLDRFARNSGDFNIGEQLLNEGYQIISATETIENTPTGRLLFRMLSSFAIFETEKHSNRQSLSGIQNLARNNLRGLGGKLDVFGYYFNDKGNKNARSEDKILTIDKDKKLIVQRIYDLYIDLSDEKSQKYIKEDTGKWTMIWKLLENKEKLLIKQYKVGEKLKNTDNLLIPAKKDISFIEGIINNNTQLKYNGVFERNISINDELIVHYIKNNSDKEGVDFEIDGTNEVGTSVVFRFKFDDLSIISDEKYKKTRKKPKKYKKRSPIIGKYTDIIKAEENNGEYFSLKANITKERIQYEPSSFKSRRKYYISQNIIDKLLLKDKKFKSIKFNEEQIEYIKSRLLKSIKSYNRDELRSLRMKKIVYERMIDDYKYMQDFMDYNYYNQSLINKQIELQNNLLYQINQEIKEVEDITSKYFDIYMGIYKNIKNIILDNDSELVNIKLKTLIDCIYLDENKQIKHIEFKKYIKELLWELKEKDI